MNTSSCRRLVRYAPQVRQSLQRLPSKSSRHLATVVDSGQRDPTEFDQVTTLPNGVRVATEALPGPFSGIGVYIDAGSRYEDENLRGVSHIVDRLAFKSTSVRTSDQMLEALELLGGNIQCASSRESLMYQSASFNSAVPTTVALLAETIRDPLITEHEIQQQLETADYEIGEIWSKPELILPELIHLAAYKDNTLGHPLLCPQERLPFINRTVVERYRDLFFRPERLVVAFAGVSHEVALKLTEQYFGDMKARESSISPSTGLETSFTDSSSSSPSSSSAYSSPPSTPPSTPSSPSQTSKLLSKIPFFKNLSTSAPSHASITPSPLFTSDSNLRLPAHYTSGFLSLPPIPPPANVALPRLSHIHIAFEAPAVTSPDIYALATLQTLLGGGGSFSAGGPGKGMYSRLYTNVLNQHGWFESCQAFNHAYTDSGLFGIAASCSPRQVGAMIDVIGRELHQLTLESGIHALREDEVARAKNQLRSSLLMNLESRMVELEDLGRQVQVHGRKIGVRDMCRAIEALTVADVRRVAGEIVRGEIRNVGGGNGGITVVVQEAEAEGWKGTKGLEWTEIQERMGRWKIGRR